MKKFLHYAGVILFGLAFSVSVMSISAQDKVIYEHHHEENQNCALSLDGQQFTTSGGSGGFTATLPGKLIDFSNVVDQIVETENDPASGVPQPDLLKEPTAILIADDFSGTPVAKALETAQANGTDPEDVSHGELVFLHTYRLVNETLAAVSGAGLLNPPITTDLSGIAPSIAPELSSIVPLFTTWNTSQFYLMGINTRDPLTPEGIAYDTGKIREDVTQTMVNMSRTLGIKRFIVNMSFDVLPCDTVDDFLTWLSENKGSGASLQDYFDTVKTSFPGIADVETWIQDRLAQVAADDALHMFVQNPTTDDCVPKPEQQSSKINAARNEMKISPTAQTKYTCLLPAEVDDLIFVASAGNFNKTVTAPDGSTGSALREPLIPAAWDEVIGVGGIEGDNIITPRTPWEPANWGKVMAPAAWYPFDFSGTTYYYAGTSFAAPVVSVMAALQVSVPTTPICPLNSIPPAFASSHPSAYADASQIPTFDEIRHGFVPPSGMAWCP